MRKLFRFFWNEFTIKISNTHVIEMGGFILCVLFFIVVLFLGQYVFNWWDITGFKEF